MTRPANTQFSLAVHLLTLLSGAAPGALTDSTRLAVSPATNPAHVRRVLGHLRAAGLVTSQPGAGGGWALARPAETITLDQVWRAVHGDDPLLGVHAPDVNCAIGRYVEENLMALDRRVLALLLAELAGQTVADVLAGAPAGQAGR